MSEPSTRETARPASATESGDVPAPGVIGIGLAAVPTFVLAQGSWQWFATFIGVTLLAVMLAFQRRAGWRPGIRSAYLRSLVAYARVVGLCVAIALAPLLQRVAARVRGGRGGAGGNGRLVPRPGPAPDGRCRLVLRSPCIGVLRLAGSVGNAVTSGGGSR
ncbi:hypothetical protein ABZ128_28980 [Streptomyces sp. NPDC006326]|uniref:hypothetical protein n=1 Tax=Streptomyces sp. NPDC006326 TaxID=3156752 RepID=UPI0033ABF1A8